MSRPFRRLFHLSRQHLSTPPPAQPSSSLSRLQSRLPTRLQPYLNPLLSAPVSHITSFLILHEITALVPLGGIFTYLHFYAPGSTSSLLEKVQDLPSFKEGLERWGRYARRKGWVSDGEEVQTVGGAQAPRIVLELAVAWAVTKVLLPARIVGSVWATPWFARTVVAPVGRLFARVRR